VLDDRLELAYGRLTGTADFLSSPFYCQFVNNGICGQPPAPFFNMPGGITAYPQGTWGGSGPSATLQAKPTQSLRSMTAIPTMAMTSPSTAQTLDGGNNGILLMTEVGCKTPDGLWSMPSRYSFGGYVHTGDFPDVAEDSKGQNLFLSGRHGREHSGQEGFYLLFEQMFFRNPNRPEAGLNGFVTFVVSPDEDKSPIPYYLNGGLIYEGLIPCRLNDKTATRILFGLVQRATAQRPEGGRAVVTNETKPTSSSIIRFKSRLISIFGLTFST
jgi:porin